MPMEAHLTDTVNMLGLVQHVEPVGQVCLNWHSFLVIYNGYSSLLL